MYFFDSYQEYSRKYDKSPSTDWYYALGLAGETGEVIELIKKANRRPPFTRPVDVEMLKDELGDVLWYLANLATKYGISLDSIAEHNLRKLEARYQTDRQ